LHQSFWLSIAQIPNNAPVPLGFLPGTPFFIIGSSLLVLFLASRNIERPHDGPKMPLGPLAPLFNNISVAGFIGSLSFGHIIGVLLTLLAAPKT
jgi:photosystem I subunit 10